MIDVLNGGKYIILSKTEYDILEKNSAERITAYNKKIANLEEKIHHLEEGKPYITLSIGGSLYSGYYSITYVENSSDDRVIRLFQEEQEKLLQIQKMNLESDNLRELRKKEDEIRQQFRDKVKNMSILEFIKLRKKSSL